MFAVGGQPHVSQGFTQRPLSSVNIQFDQTWDYPKGLWYRIWGDIVNSNSTSCAHSSTKITKHETVALKQTLFSSYGEGLSLDHSYRRRFGRDSRSWKNFFEGWPLKRSQRRLLDVELAMFAISYSMLVYFYFGRETGLHDAHKHKTLAESEWMWFFVICCVANFW